MPGSPPMTEKSGVPRMPRIYEKHGATRICFVVGMPEMPGLTGMRMIGIPGMTGLPVTNGMPGMNIWA